MRLNVQNQRCAHLEMKRVEIITKDQIALFFFCTCLMLLVWLQDLSGLCAFNFTKYAVAENGCAKQLMSIGRISVEKLIHNNGYAPSQANVSRNKLFSECRLIRLKWTSFVLFIPNEFFLRPFWNWVVLLSLDFESCLVGFTNYLIISKKKKKHYS